MNELSIRQIDFRIEDIKSVKEENLTDFPVVYLLNDEKEIYIGETTAVKNRLKQHLKNEKRNNLKKVSIIGHGKFNQSATYNVETNLINFFTGDEKYKVQNISQTTNFTVHNYYEKRYYHQEVTSVIWDKLMSLGLAENTIDVITNKDIYKVSPYKSLTSEQQELKTEIVNFCLEHSKSEETAVFVIEGEAGSGKSVVISSIMKTIQDLAHDKTSDLYQSNNYLLVNHSEMLKTYERLSKLVKNFQKKSFQKPTSFINLMDKNDLTADVVIVDEGHLLLSKSDAFNNFKYDNHLEEIIKRAKITVVVFDSKQSLKVKSKWGNDELKRLLKPYKTKFMKLEQQFRMKASEPLVNWIDSFISKDLKSIPNDQFYDFRVFTDAQEMYNEIKKRNSERSLSRIVSTFDYLHKKDGKEYYVEEGRFKLPWNKTYKTDISWAEIQETINEVGSIYTVQGFDMNYIGVIIGPSIYFDEVTQEIKVDVSKYKDTGAFSGASELKNANEVKEKIILNGLNVLMKRGIDGLYIYASDEKLRNKLNELYEEMEQRKNQFVYLTHSNEAVMQVSDFEKK